MTALHRTDDAANTRGPSRPVLAVTYDVTSSSPLELVGLLGDRYTLVWIVEAGDATLGSWARLLPRLGRVVDATGRSVDEVAADLAAVSVDGVIAFTDSQLLLAARLSAALGLEGNTPEVVEALIDKIAQRRALDAGGLAGPRFVRLDPATGCDEVVRQTAGLHFPVAVKPVRGSGSRLTVRAADPEGVAAHLLGARDAAVGDFIVEEWLAEIDPCEAGPFADYVSVEVVANRGLIVPLAVTGKFPLAEPCLETGNFMPHHLDPPLASAVVDVAVRAAWALGVSSGALHIEVKLTPSGPRVIELNGRVGGGAIDRLFAMTHGRSLTELAAAAALGEPVDPAVLDVPRLDGIFYAFFLQPPTDAWRLDGLDGLLELSSLDGVLATAVNRNIGDLLDWRDGSQGYLLSVQGVAPDLAALAQVPDRVTEVLDITFGYAQTSSAIKPAWP